LLKAQIGLVQNFFLAKLHANNEEPLVEDEDLPIKQRAPKPRLPPTVSNESMEIVELALKICRAKSLCLERDQYLDRAAILRRRRSLILLRPLETRMLENLLTQKCHWLRLLLRLRTMVPRRMKMKSIILVV